MKTVANDIINNIDHKKIVVWSELYETGVAQIDKQHMELVDMTNELYEACLEGKTAAAFKEAMSKMVEYVRFHFTEELKLLEQINFPQIAEHKQQHDTLVWDILEAVKEYNEGKKYTPNHFVRILKEWVFGHIAISDQSYAIFVAEQRQKGLLAEL